MWSSPRAPTLLPPRTRRTRRPWLANAGNGPYPAAAAPGEREEAQQLPRGSARGSPGPPCGESLAAPWGDTKAAAGVGWRMGRLQHRVCGRLGRTEDQLLGVPESPRPAACPGAAPWRWPRCLPGPARRPLVTAAWPPIGRRPARGVAGGSPGGPAGRGPAGRGALWHGRGQGGAAASRLGRDKESSLGCSGGHTRVVCATLGWAFGGAWAAGHGRSPLSPEVGPVRRRAPEAVRFAVPSCSPCLWGEAWELGDGRWARCQAEGPGPPAY